MGPCARTGPLWDDVILLPAPTTDSFKKWFKTQISGTLPDVFTYIVWFQKISIPPHGGSRNFLGVGGSKRDKFPKGRGVHKEFFFPEGLKCDRINTYVLLFHRQTTHTPLRHTSEQHVQCRVKQNGRLEKFCSQSPKIGRIERTRGNEFELKWVISLFAFAHFHWLFIFTRLASRSLDLFLI